MKMLCLGIALVLASPAAAQEKEWVNLGNGGEIPGELAGHAMVWVGPKLYVFGGLKQNAYPTSELHVWDSENSTWSTPPIVGDPPPPRFFHSMVFDSTGGRLLVFGGRGYEVWFGDVYAYTLSTNEWANITPITGIGPDARYGHAAIYDPVEDRMLVFGGYIPDTLEITKIVWQLSLGESVSWSALTEAPMPSDRVFHSAVTDPTTHIVYVFGGFVPATWTNTIFRFDLNGNSWLASLSNLPGPPKMGLHAAAWDSINEKMLVYGGYGGELGDLQVFDKFWEFDPANITWKNLDSNAPPGPRAAAAAAFDPAGRFFMYGGANGVTINLEGYVSLVPAPDDLWKYTVANSTPLPPPPPPPPPPRGPVTDYGSRKNRFCGGGATEQTGTTIWLIALVLLAYCGSSADRMRWRVRSAKLR